MENNTMIVPNEIEALIDAMKSVGGGELTQMAATNLQKVVKATMLEGKNSTIQINLKIVKTNEEMIIIEGTTKATLPTPKITGAFFVDKQKYLPSRNRPDQMVMDFNK